MLGKRSPQTNLFDVGNVFDLDLKPSSFHAQLTQVAPLLFDDADFIAADLELGGGWRREKGSKIAVGSAPGR